MSKPANSSYFVRQVCVGFAWSVLGFALVPGALAQSLPAPSLVSPAGGGSGLAGVSRSFHVAFSDAAGYADVTAFNLVFGGTNLAGVCYLTYYPSYPGNPGLGSLFLWNDAGTGHTYGTPGAAVILQNSQCSVDLAHTSVTGSGTILTFNPTITFSAGFAGSREIFALGVNAANQYSPWVDLGSWTVTLPLLPVPYPSLVSPAGGGSGLAAVSQSFQVAYSDATGYRDVTAFNLVFGGTSLAGGCYLTYYPSYPGNPGLGSLFLWNDAGTGHTYGTPGAAVILQNSQCSVDLAHTSVTGSGTILTFNPTITFSTAFAGSREIFALGVNAANQYSPWVDLGAWTVTLPLPNPSLVSPAGGGSGLAGVSQSFQVAYSDATGYADVTSFNLVFGGTGLAGTCYLTYYPSYPGNPGLGSLFIWNDAGTGHTFGTPGTAVTLQNSQCSVDLAHTSVTGSGIILTFSPTITFSTAFAGSREIFALGVNAANQYSPWVDLGAWTVWPVAPITFQSNPSGRSIRVDGSPYTTPTTITLSAGSHTIDASIAQNSPAGTRYNFQSWSDNGAATHTVTTTGSAATFTANFTTQYQLTATSGTGGTVSQSEPSGWYTSGTQASVAASANLGYQFLGFSGTATGTNNPLYLTMNGPSTLAASFAPLPPAVNVTPSSGAGASQILTGAYIDPVAFGRITEAMLLVNSSAATASACYVRWTTGNHFYLRNDTDSAWLDGTTASVQNTQCRLDAPANGAQGSGQTLTANFGLTFLSTFAGAKNVYLTTTTPLGTASWQQAGTWSVDMTAGDYSVNALTPTATTSQNGTVQYQYKVTAIGGMDGSGVRVQGIVIPSTPPCLAWWNQASGWDPATRIGTVTLWIQASGGCGGGYTFTYTPQVTWQSIGGLSKTTTDTTLVCCGSAPISITATPTSTTLRAGQSATFTATVKGTLNTGVTWDNPGIGTLTQNGIYTAPANISTTQYVVITAHSNQDSSKTASATITLQPAAPTNVPQYTITGQVVQADGSAFGPISINVTGDQARTVANLSDGTYSIPPLPAGHYVVAPSSDYGAATPVTYDLLSSRNGRHVLKPFRFSPLNRAPEPDPDPAEARGLVHVTANGLAQKADFWWNDSHINARDIDASQGCWIMPINGPADYSHRDTSIGVSYTPDSSGPHFVVTFTAPPSAIGFRELVCRYGGKDIIGWDYISFEAAPPIITTISPRVLTLTVSPPVGSILISGDRLDLPTVSVDGSGLSVSVNYAQSNDIGISLGYTLSDTALPGPRTLTVTTVSGSTSVVIHVLPSVIIAPIPGVGVGYDATVTVNLSSPSASEPIVLEIWTPVGTGTVQFSDGTTSKTLTQSDTLSVKGVQVSSTADNISIRAKPQLVDNTTITAAGLTAVTVTVTLDATVRPPSGDNDKRDAFLANIPSLGPVIATDPKSRQRYCAIGVEFVGAVSPSNYSGNVTLKRKITSDAAYKGSVLTEPSNPQPDTSFDVFLDSDPQSGGSAGKVYDLDAPGQGIVSGDPSTYRVRNNFAEYAVLGDRDSEIRASADLQFYSATSCAPDKAGQPSFNNDFPNDNKVGLGSISTTFDLR